MEVLISILRLTAGAFRGWCANFGTINPFCEALTPEEVVGNNAKG
jgi:hypothetical protein